MEYTVHPQDLVGNYLSKELAESREELYLHRFLGALLSPALKMLRAGKADDEILEFTELTKEALNSLKEQVCTA